MDKKRFASAIVVLFFTPLLVAQASPSKADVERRAESILGAMTLEEKITILGGIDDFYTWPIPRLGILSLRMSDGPLGVRTSLSRWLLKKNEIPMIDFRAGLRPCR